MTRLEWTTRAPVCRALATLCRHWPRPAVPRAFAPRAIMTTTQILPRCPSVSPALSAPTAMAWATRSKRCHCSQATGDSHAMRLTYDSAQTLTRAMSLLASEAQARPVYSGQRGPTANSATSQTARVITRTADAWSAKPRVSSSAAPLRTPVGRSPRCWLRCSLSSSSSRTRKSGG